MPIRLPSAVSLTLASALTVISAASSKANVIEADFTVLPGAWVQDLGLVPPFFLPNQPTITGHVVFTTEGVLLSLDYATGSQRWKLSDVASFVITPPPPPNSDAAHDCISQGFPICANGVFPINAYDFGITFNAPYNYLFSNATASIFDGTNQIACNFCVLITSENIISHGNAYITNQGPGNVSVIDAASNTVVTTIPISVSAMPTGVAVTPDGSKVYVTNEGNDTVSVIATASNTVVATVPVHKNPIGVAVTPDGSTVYVANFQGDNLSVIDIATNTIVRTVPLGQGPGRIGPFGVAMTPDGSKLYVTNFYDNTVSVIAAATSKVLTKVPVGQNPVGVAVTPDGSKVYVANQLSPNTVAVIATASDTVVATVPVGQNPVGVAVTPDGSKVYVANFSGGTTGSVSVINASNDMVEVPAIPVEQAPIGVAVTPDGSRVYVVNHVSNDVSVIDTGTNTVIDSIPVGTSPNAFGTFTGRFCSTCQ
jgi:YVTN family beta-propeller protein